MPSPKYKKCQLPGARPHLLPGQTFKSYGHIWTVQPNRMATADIHVDFHEVEVAAGRYTILKEESKVEIQDSLKVFSMDPATYYGTGSYDAFKEKLSQQTAAAIIQFAQTRLNVKPPSLPKAELIKDILELGEEAYKQSHKKKEKNSTFIGKIG